MIKTELLIDRESKLQINVICEYFEPIKEDGLPITLILHYEGEEYTFKNCNIFYAPVSNDVVMRNFEQKIMPPFSKRISDELYEKYNLDKNKLFVEYAFCTNITKYPESEEGTIVYSNILISIKNKMTNLEQIALNLQCDINNPYLTKKDKDFAVKQYINYACKLQRESPNVDVMNQEYVHENLNELTSEFSLIGSLYAKNKYIESLEQEIKELKETSAKDFEHIKNLSTAVINVVTKWK